MSLSGKGAVRAWEGLSESMNLCLDGQGCCSTLESSTVEVGSWSFLEALDISLEVTSRGHSLVWESCGSPFSSFDSSSSSGESSEELAVSECQSPFGSGSPHGQMVLGVLELGPMT